MNEEFQYIWDRGYHLKITEKEVWVYEMIYNENLDLDQYCTIVNMEHHGDVLGTIPFALRKAIRILELVK